MTLGHLHTLVFFLGDFFIVYHGKCLLNHHLGNMFVFSNNLKANSALQASYYEKKIIAERSANHIHNTHQPMVQVDWQIYIHYAGGHSFAKGGRVFVKRRWIDRWTGGSV